MLFTFLFVTLACQIILFSSEVFHSFLLVLSFLGNFPVSLFFFSKVYKWGKWDNDWSDVQNH